MSEGGEKPGGFTEKYQKVRRALVDEKVKQYPGLSHTDFNDVDEDKFDEHATTLSEQREAQSYELIAKREGKTVDEVKAMFATEPDEGQAKQKVDTVASLGSAGRPPADLGREARDPNASGLDRVMQFHRTARKS